MSYSPYNLDAAAGGQKSETKRVILIIIASMLGFVLLVAFLVLTLKLPTVLSSRRAANEAAALSTIHNIATAEATYRDVHRGYGSGEELAAGGFIDAGFAGGSLEKNGYVFKLAVTPETEYVSSRYVITASPSRALEYRRPGRDTSITIRPTATYARTKRVPPRPTTPYSTSARGTSPVGRRKGL